MRTICILLFIAVTITDVFSQEIKYPEFEELDRLIKLRSKYHEEKEEYLDSITKLGSLSASNSDKFYHYQTLFEEYSVFNYDSAFHYAMKMHSIATQESELQKINLSRLKLGFTFLAGGLFSEALDTLAAIEPNLLEQSIKHDYFYLLARTYFEMSEYNNKKSSSALYDSLGLQALSSALKNTKPDSDRHLSILALIHLRNKNIPSAITDYEDLIYRSQNKLSVHHFAIEATNLSYAYRLNNQHVKSNEMLVKAAISDIVTATKETVALRILAEELFRFGDVERSYRYINIALEEAKFYEANHRKIQISNILPIIEKERLRRVEEQKKKLWHYFIGLSILSGIVIALVVIVLVQIKRIRSGQKELSIANEVLLETNNKLLETDKIKEEYIGYFFKALSENIEQNEKLKRAINRLLTTKNYNEIKITIRSLDVKKEREKLYIDFDRSFLSIFPNFIEQLNLLLTDENKIVLGRDNLLLPEVRIMALIRLGITDINKIAAILNYSLNTIYTYKTKIKNRAIISNDEFEDRIMKIRTID